MNKLIIIIISFVLISCVHRNNENPHVIITTRLGEIEFELYPSKAPKTTAAFLSNIKSGIYENSSFYRVLKTEELPTDFNTGLIQGGIWKTSPAKGKNIPGINHESTKQTGLSHTDGTISMARKDTGTATTEFFICIGDQSSLDSGKRGTPDGQGYAAFGKIVNGMDIVRKIQSQKSKGDSFDELIEIKNITLQ